jgi:hypothetical protein
VELDGQKFDSKAEARYWQHLMALKDVGVVVQVLRQVQFHLPGGVKYICDFQVFLATGEVEFLDVKGMDTPASRLKRKQVAELYAPIEIKVIKNV